MFVIEQLWAFSWGDDKALEGYKPIGYVLDEAEAQEIVAAAGMMLGFPEKQYFKLENISKVARADEETISRYNNWKERKENITVINSIPAQDIKDYLTTENAILNIIQHNSARIK